METKTYAYDYRGIDMEAIIEEMTRKEFIESAQWTIEGIRDYHDPDSSLYVEYKNGSWFHMQDFDGYIDISGDAKWRKSNIAWGLISNGSTWQVFGDYELDENGIPQRKAV